MSRTLALVLSTAAALATAGPARALTITATSNAATSTPSTVAATSDLQNGDFRILANGLASATGDGVDETTTWTFDFRGHPNFAAFQSGGTVASAVLSLTLNTLFLLPTDPGLGKGPITDAARPGDTVVGIFPQWGVPEFLAGTFGNYSQGTVSTDLVVDVGESGAALNDWLNGKAGALTGLHAAGLFPMIYLDDAIVVSASLTLSDTAPVPEPASAALLAMGLVGLAARRR